MTSSKALVLRYFQMWNTGETGAVDELIGETLTYHARPEVSDGQDLAAVIRDSREQDPSIHVFVDAVLGDGRMITVVGRVRSTSDGPERVRSRVWAFRLEERISEIWRY